MLIWCKTNYVLKGANKEQTKDLFEKIESLKKMEKPLVENDFGNLWLGCLINKLGGDWHSVQCCGWIEKFELKEDVLYMDCVTEWGELYEFRCFIEQQYPGSKMFYREFEPNRRVYNTNDVDGKYFKEKYMVITDNGGKLFETSQNVHFETIEETAKYIENIIGKKVEPDYSKIDDAVTDYMVELECGDTHDCNAPLLLIYQLEYVDDDVY